MKNNKTILKIFAIVIAIAMVAPIIYNAYVSMAGLWLLKKYITQINLI